MKGFRDYLENNGRKLAVLTGQLCLAALSIWAIAFSLTYFPGYAFLYRKAFATPGHKLISEISRYYTSSQKTCFVVGVSSMNCGIDFPTLKEKFSDYDFIDFTTSGGTIYKIGMSLSLMTEYSVKPDCIVIGIHPSLLHDRNLSLVNQGFLDVMGIKSQRRYIHRELAQDRYYTLLVAEQRFLWPGIRAALQLNRLYRFLIFKIQNLKGSSYALGKEHFEFFNGELSALDLKGNLKHLNEQELQDFYNRMEQEGLLDPEGYALPSHIECLNEIVSSALTISGKTIVVTMPESEYARNLSERTSSRREYDECLNTFRGNNNLTLLNMSSAYPDEAFDAIYHLLPDFSLDFTRQLADTIKPVIR